MTHKQHTLLVIEDNEINRDILGDILSEDYNVLYAVNGKDGMDQLALHKVSTDLVLLDIHMPVMDGYEVLRAVRNDPDLKEIPVIVMTSNDRDEDEECCLRLGASDFIPKPYNPTIVRLRIETILRLLDTTRNIHYKKSFMQNISHEIRTPLTALYGYSQLLGMSGSALDDAERGEYNNIIENSYQMIEMLLQDLFDTADYDKDHYVVNVSDVSVNNVCHNALSAGRCRLPQGVDMRFESDVADGFTIRSDGKRIQQVLTNFLTNACKNTESGSIVLRCSCAERPGRVTFSVSDTGPGVPADKTELIFKRFVKLDPYKQGAGLGLYICSIIADKLGAELYLDTSYTEGARFVFSIDNQ